MYKNYQPEIKEHLDRVTGLKDNLDKAIAASISKKGFKNTQTTRQKIKRSVKIN